MSNKPTQYKAYEYTGDSLVYSIIEVDAVLAEKDKEIAELKAKLESVQASMYCDVVDANMEVRRLRKALYNLRIAYAKKVQDYINADWYDGFEKDLDFWDNVEQKCKAKAEEYK